MRIALVGSRGIPASWGGVERAFEEIGARLVSRGHSVTVYGRRHWSLDSQHLGVEVVTVPHLGTPGLEAASATIATLFHPSLRSHDVILFGAIGPAGVSPLTRFLLRVPSVGIVNGADWERKKWPAPMRFVLRSALRMAGYGCSVLVCVNRDLTQRLRGLSAAEVVFIPNGASQLAEPDDLQVLWSAGLVARGYVLYFGRLVPEKRVEDLLAADLSLPIAIVGGDSGSSNYSSFLRSKAGANVHWLGFRQGPELGTLVRNAGVVVNPSELEGMPIAMLEAGLAGTPMVVSDIPGHTELPPEVVQKYPVGDVPALAGAVGKALLDDSDGTRMQRAEVFRRLFDWDAIVTAYEEVLGRVAAAG